jgi:hypothetical protein
VDALADEVRALRAELRAVAARFEPQPPVSAAAPAVDRPAPSP